MPAQSKSQQRLMGIAYAVKKGDMDIDELDAPENVKDTVEDLVDSMSLKTLKDFASTKHTNLPDKVASESFMRFVESLSIDKEYLHPINIKSVLEWIDENMSTLSNTPGMGAVMIGGDEGSGDIPHELSNLYTDDGQLKTPFCNPEKDKKCAFFRRDDFDWYELEKFQDDFDL